MGGAGAGDDGGPDGEYPAALPGHQASRTPAQLAWSTTSTTGSPGAPSRCSSPGAACPSAASASSSCFTPRCGASASSPSAPCRTGGAADGSSLPACGLRPQRSAVIQRRQARGTKAEWPPRPDGQPSQDGGPAHSASSLNQPQDQLACADHPPATRPAASLGVCRAREVRRFAAMTAEEVCSARFGAAGQLFTRARETACSRLAGIAIGSQVRRGRCG